MKMKIVRILWQDARSFQELMDDEDLQEALKNGLARYESVGFLIGQTKEIIALALGHLPPMHARDISLYRNVLLIPKKLILEKEILR